MSSEKTLAVRAALESGGSAGESQLAVIAAGAGDGQLQLVVESLTAAEINVLVADADMSKPSVAHAFITVEQFLGAFSRLGARWARFDTLESSADFLEVQSAVEDFLCPMVLASEDPVRAKTMLEALFEHELGAEAVLFTAIDRKDYQEFIAAPRDFPITRGTWQELLHATLEYYPAGYAEVSAHARALFEDGEGGTLSFAATFINAMYDEAHKDDAPAAAESEDFVDI